MCENCPPLRQAIKEIVRAWRRPKPQPPDNGAPAPENCLQCRYHKELPDPGDVDRRDVVCTLAERTVTTHAKLWNLHAECERPTWCLWIKASRRS